MNLAEWLFEPFIKSRALEISPFSILKFLVLGGLLILAARLVKNNVRKTLVHRAGVEDGVAYAVSRICYYILILGGAFAILHEMGINVASLATFAGALGVGIGLGLQGIARNFVSGLILLLGRTIRQGDRIELRTVSGDVQSISLYSTVLRSPEDADIVIPNSMILEEPVINWTLQDRRRLVATEVQVKYEEDPVIVKELLEAVARRTPGVLENPTPDARLKAFGDHALVFRLLVWTEDYVFFPNKLISELNYAILAELNSRGMALPYPTQVIHRIGGEEN